MEESLGKLLAISLIRTTKAKIHIQLILFSANVLLEIFSICLLKHIPSLFQVSRHLFSTDAKLFENLMFRTCANQGVRNVSFSENFVYVINGYLTQCFYFLEYPSEAHLRPYQTSKMKLICKNN